ncbi:MAG: efflux RND transporter permease subunit [Myxococcales bacterium]|jgi:hydrophobe/amphiphile efflux-1 (HAE1) family protein|nr:efflux RND transporter permease subunit [Myxococcales bacterium]
MKLTEVCIRNPVFAWMLMGATILFGAVSFTKLGISQFPDVDFPIISVSVTWEGAAPEVMERDVVEPIEEALMQVEGVKSLTSTSRQGTANIMAEMHLSRPVDLAMQDVQAAVARTQRRLPEGIEAPIVAKSNPEDNPIIWLGLAGPFPPQVLADYARYRVRERLQIVPGVGEITLGGSLDRNVRVWIDADALHRFGLTVAEVIDALQKQHVELPAGRIEAFGREINVRVLGEALDLTTLENLFVADVAGTPVRLKDVALIEDGFEDKRRLARVNGEPAQGMGIRKQRGANAVAVAQAIHAELDQIRKELPEGMSLNINFDSTKFIEESVHEIEFEILLSVLLTALICWLFLGSLSSTLNVLLAIPMSLMGTVAVIHFLGFTLNTFTLLGLTLAIGIVVDDAIMVMENIFRHAEGGKDRVSAAREGTQEITFAALAATLAIVAIFLPIAFMDGIIGRYFMQFAVTISVAVMISYVEAVTLAPARCAQFLKASHEDRNALGRLVDRAFCAVERFYARVLKGALRHPGVVLVLSVILLAAAGFFASRLPREFVPSQDQSRIVVSLRAAVGTNMDETDRLFKRAEAIAQALPETLTLFNNVGGRNANTGRLFITIPPPNERERTQKEIEAELRTTLNAIPGLKAVVMDLSQSGFSAQRGFPVEFSVRGANWDDLVTASEAAMNKLNQSGAVIDLDSDYEMGMPELRIVPDRERAADLGVSMQTVSSTINALVGGLKVASYTDDNRRLDMRVRLLADQRARPEELSALMVKTDSDEVVPLASIAQFEERPALQLISRRERERAITVYGNIAPGHSQAEVLELVNEVSREAPKGTRIVISGSSQTFQDSMSGLFFALLMGIAIAYMVLASQFNSFLHPITVITILPLSAAGAVAALMAMGMTLNIFSMIGLLLLMGIVKKNSIILVDYANQLRGPEHGGLDALNAMQKAGPVRLRPIVMTSAAMLAAALPAALALGPGSETRAPMSITIIGGLVISTGLSLVVVPAFYVVADRVLRAIAARRKSKTAFSV